MSQRKRPGTTAYRERQQAALDRLLENYPVGTERSVAIQQQIHTLMKALGMSVQEAM